MNYKRKRLRLVYLAIIIIGILIFIKNTRSQSPFRNLTEENVREITVLPFAKSNQYTFRTHDNLPPVLGALRKIKLADKVESPNVDSKISFVMIYLYNGDNINLKVSNNLISIDNIWYEASPGSLASLMNIIDRYIK